MGRKSKHGRDISFVFQENEYTDAELYNQLCYKDQIELHKERHAILTFRAASHKLSWMRKSPTEGKNEPTIVISMKELMSLPIFLARIPPIRP